MAGDRVCTIYDRHEKPYEKYDFNAINSNVCVSFVSHRNTQIVWIAQIQSTNTEMPTYGRNTSVALVTAQCRLSWCRIWDKAYTGKKSALSSSYSEPNSLINI